MTGKKWMPINLQILVINKKKNMFELKGESSQVKAGIMVGLIESLYVIVIALLMINLTALMVNVEEVFAIGLVLMLLVFSAAISGVLVFGLPIYLFLQKRIKDAIKIMVTTFLTLLGIFFIILLFAGIYVTQ
ncbi:hypothetical protein KJ733_05090 [Patescibacteria group bacterium]|nr:hypothetical protein [Patescibacteria group bacterium]